MSTKRLLKYYKAIREHNFSCSAYDGTCFGLGRICDTYSEEYLEKVKLVLSEREHIK